MNSDEGTNSPPWRIVTMPSKTTARAALMVLLSAMPFVVSVASREGLDTGLVL